MITNIPKPSQYKVSGVECLIQAYDNVFKIDNELTPDTPRDRIWEYNQIVLRTSLVLIHQGVEGLMKAKICEVSPLLLLDKKRSEWKTLPNSTNDAYDDLHTIGGDDLLRTFYGCIPRNAVHARFMNLYEEIRVARNKIVHGIGAIRLKPEYILHLVLNSFTFLLGKDSFWDSVMNRFYDHPGFEFQDEELEWQDKFQYNRMEYLDCFLGKKILKHHFSVDIMARPYYCPICTENAELITDKGIEHPSSKWAFLNPNTPESTDMSCIVCRTDFGIKREDCGIDGCKGNVKYLIEDEDEGDKEIWICLTCWKTEDDAEAG